MPPSCKQAVASEMKCHTKCTGLFLQQVATNIEEKQLF